MVANLAMIRGVKDVSKEIETIDKKTLDNYNVVINYIIMCFIFDHRKII